jgi:hypothetical protein
MSIARPEDLAKLGQLVAIDGRWSAKQVLPAGWMVESTRPRINTHINTERYRPLNYGYQWWLGRSLLSGHELPLITAFDNGGLRPFVVPELDLVVAINAAGSLLQALIPAAILNQLVLPAVNDYPSHAECRTEVAEVCIGFITPRPIGPLIWAARCQREQSFLPSLQFFCAVWRALFFRPGPNVRTSAGAQEQSMAGALCAPPQGLSLTDRASRYAWKPVGAHSVLV